MAISRYSNDASIKGGRLLKTAGATTRIRLAYNTGRIVCKERILKESERIDHVAAQELGDGRLWWVIAAVSGIGWGMQLPPGTILKIPTNLTIVAEVV